MAHKIFIAATGQNSGKTTTSVSLMHLARRKYGRVGFLKPLGPKPRQQTGSRKTGSEPRLPPARLW